MHDSQRQTCSTGSGTWINKLYESPLCSSAYWPSEAPIPLDGISLGDLGACTRVYNIDKWSRNRRKTSRRSLFLRRLRDLTGFSLPGQHPPRLRSACVAPFSTRQVEGEPSRDASAGLRHIIHFPLGLDFRCLGPSVYSQIHPRIFRSCERNHVLPRVVKGVCVPCTNRYSEMQDLRKR
jgi:hypothetical protein